MSDPSPPPDLRERLLRAATALFAHRGYSATSVREIAESVGCTKPALYYHFRSKEHLFLEAVQSPVFDYLRLMQEMASPGELALGERIRRFLEGCAELVRASPDAARLVLMVAHGPSDAVLPPLDLRGLSSPEASPLVAYLRGAADRGELRAGVDPEDLAMALTALVHHLVLRVVSGDPPPPGASDRLVNLLLYGVSP